MPLMSIVVPVYNAQKFLRQCLGSLRRQTFIDWECVCVDDGSDDSSGVILDEYAAMDVRFRVVHQANSGVWAARNAALGLVCGEWVTFVDSDDVLNPHWLEEGLRIAKATNADLVRLDYFYGKSMPGGFLERGGGWDYMVKDGTDAAAWMWDTMASRGFLWLCFIRRELIRDLAFPCVNCKEDSLFLLGLAYRVKRVAQGLFKGYFYRNTGGSLMKRNRSVSQSVVYLGKMKSLWELDKSDAARVGYLDVMRRNIRASVDNDVIEWVMKRQPVDDVPREKIRDAYRMLQVAGALDAPYANRKRYRIGFGWWQMTGQIWAIRWPGMLFLWLRQGIDGILRFKVQSLRF